MSGSPLSVAITISGALNRSRTLFVLAAAVPVDVVAVDVCCPVVVDVLAVAPADTSPPEVGAPDLTPPLSPPESVDAALVWSVVVAEPPYCRVTPPVPPPVREVGRPI